MLPNSGQGPVVVLNENNMFAAFDPEGREVWCTFADQFAMTNNDFCQFCGSTDHEPVHCL